MSRLTAVITVVSGTKGGTGKTTVAVNIAVLASYRLRALSKYPVVLIDLGIDNGTASKVLMGNLTGVSYTVSDYLMGKINNPLYAFYLKSWNVGGDEFKVVFSVPGRLVEGVPFFRLRYIVRSVLDYIKPTLLIIDTPSTGFTRQFMEPILSETTHILPITTVDHSSIESLASIIGFIKGIRGDVKVLPPILNMYDYRYSIDPTTGKDWSKVVEENIGLKPYTIAYDRLFYIVRQAMEVEVLKLAPYESAALNDIVRYFDEVIEPLAKPSGP